jgi:hypothetical protein
MVGRGLGEAKALALFGELVTPLLSHDRTAATGGLLLADTRTASVPVPL